MKDSLGPAPRLRGRYRNPDGSRGGQTLGNLYKLIREAGGDPWPAQVENTPYPLPDPSPGQVALTWVGHSSWLVRTPELSLLLDPIWSDRCSPVSWWGPKRVRPPGLDWDRLPKIDAVLVSHAHYDHMDRPTLQRLYRRDAPLLFTAAGNARRLRRWGVPGAVELDWGETTPLPAGADATFLPTRHFAARTPFDHSRSLWGAFAITLPLAGGGRFRLCFLGDTAWGDHLADIGRLAGPFDAALIPIGAYEPRWFMEAVHITPEEAAEAQHLLRARTALAMHHSCFRLTREPIGEPAERLLAVRGDADFRIPDVGETMLLCSDAAVPKP